MKDFARLLHEAQVGGYNIGACVRISNAAHEVLLIKRTTDDFFGGIWEIPGGAVDPGEEVQQAAAREVREETGLTIDPDQLQYHTFFDFHNIETGKRKRKFVFTVAMEGDITTSHEHSDHKWATLEAIAQLKRQSQHADYEIWDDHYNAIMLQD